MIIPRSHSPGFLKLDGMEFFEKKNFKNCIWYAISQKRRLYSFMSSGAPFPQKQSCPENNFSPLFWKILFFSKKLLNEKYSIRRCQQKRLYWFLSSDASSPQNGHVLPQMGFCSFLQKIPLFSKNLFYIKTSIT